MSGALNARVRFPARGLDVSLAVESERVTALLGPNGAGKSTVADAVAGLLRPTEGSITVADRLLFDSDHGVDVPAHRRPVALLGQNARLFPHLRVRANVAFAPRNSGLGRTAAAARAEHWLDAVGALHLADRRALELSGGQAQRVALARALAAQPQVLILDEPLSSLDVTARVEMRSTLRTALEGLTCILITHDPADVVALAHDAAVLDRGEVVDRRTAGDVLLRPLTRFEAELAGMNLLPDRDGSRVFGPDAVDVRHISDDNDDGAGIPGTVVEVTLSGGRYRVTSEVDTAGEQTSRARVTADLPADRRHGLRPGDAVVLHVDDARAHRIRPG